MSKRKHSLKKSFKAGGLSQQEYMLELAEVKSAMQEEERILCSSFREIFSPILSECVHCNNLMESIEALIATKYSPKEQSFEPSS